MKKCVIIIAGAFILISSAAALCASETKDPMRVGGFTLKAGNCADSVADTLIGERNLYLDFAAKNEDGTVNAAVEIPAGTNDKWETDVENGHLFWECKSGVKRVVKFLGYPANYGMIPRTKGGDGDPLDIIIMGGMIRRGGVAPVKPIGVFFLNDNGSIDDKILAVLPGSFMDPINSLAEFTNQYPGVLSIIETWFTHYKGIDGALASNGFGNVDTALKIIDAAIHTYEATVYPAAYTVYPAAYNESPDDSLTIDGFARTYGKYGMSLTGVLGDDDTLSNGKNMYLEYKARNSDKTVNAVIEIPCGTQSKWETDVNTGKFFWENRLGVRRVVRFLGYPGDYGMVPRTKGGDGDPLDVVILGAVKLRGEVVPAKVIGVMFLLDAGLLDDKLIAVIPGQHMGEINTMAELSAQYPGVQSIIETWFTNYKGIGGGLVSHGFGEWDTANIILDKAIFDFGDPVKWQFSGGPGRSFFKLNRIDRMSACITVAFSLAHPDRIRMCVYSLSGEEQTVLTDKKYASGEYRISWDVRLVQTGCYIIKVQAGGQTQVIAVHVVR